MSAEEIAARQAEANAKAQVGAKKIFILVNGLASVRFCVHADKVLMVRGMSTYQLTLEKARKEYARLRDELGYLEW